MLNQKVRPPFTHGGNCSCVSSEEHAAGNTVRRLLHTLREEYANAKGANAAAPRQWSRANFVLQGQPRKQVVAPKAESSFELKENDKDDPDSFARTIKPVLIEAIQDIEDELETVYDNVGKSAKDHIHSE